METEKILTGKRVLIVDDEEDILDQLMDILTMCNVDRASTFEEAKELLENNFYHIAVLDIMGVHGYELLEIANRKRTPALMLTAHAFTPDNIVRSIREGAASYVPKEELSRIEDFLNDIFVAQERGESPWLSWQKRLPGSYFETRFGAAWKAADKAFLEALRASILSREKDSKKA